MKKILLAAFIVMTGIVAANAQAFITRDAKIYFNPNKDQKNKEYAAQTKEATAKFDSDKGTVALLVAMKTFHFNNALLEEHFNENYLHTNKIPNATYTGKLIGFDKSMLAKNGVYKISSEGTVDMHGVKKPFKGAVTMTVNGKNVTFDCAFFIKAVDHNIDIPALVKPKLAEATPLTANITFKM